MVIVMMVIIVAKVKYDNLQGCWQPSLVVGGRCEASVIIATM